MAKTVLSCLGLGVAAVTAAGAVVGLTGYTSPEALAASSALGGVAGNFATDLFKVLHRPAAERWLDGRSGIDENHQVASALRLAQLAALRAVLDRFEGVWKSDVDYARRAEAERFNIALQEFIDAETTAAERHGFLGVGDGLTAEERVLRQEVLAKLPDVFDESLAARRARNDKAAFAESLTCLREAVEGAILTEIRVRNAAVGRDLPVAFIWAFEGTGFPDSWFDLFVRDAAFRLKKEPDFERVWAAEQQSLVRAIADSHTVVLAEINERTKRIERILVSEANDAARGRDVAEGFIREMAARVGADLHLDLEGMKQVVRNAIEIYEREIAGGRTETNLGEIVDQALANAKRLAADGKSRLARAALRTAADKLRREEEERRAAHAERIAALFSYEHDIALAAYDGEAAAGAIEAMAESLHSEARGRRDVLIAEGDRLETFGEQRGSNVHLIAAISVRGAALRLATTADETGFDRINLGNALRALGERESGTARLEEAVTAYRAALQEYTRERVPLQWARTQNNLGTALFRLGERESGTARLEEAVTVYRAALQERTRERVPLDWAMTQSNLGTALRTLGDRESDPARLEEAVTAHRAALQERTRERVPLDWATTQNNLGIALQTLGDRESATARLEEAVTAYRAALQEYTRERVPLDWAMTQNNLGNALQTLGGRENDTARLEEAVAAYRAALQEHTRERVPLKWAATQNNLGIALRMLGTRESDTARLEEAVTAYRAALQEYTRERVPLQWATTQNNLGTTLRTLGARESDTARLEEAVTVYRAALQEYTRERVPLDWAMTQNNLGIALQTLGERENGTALLEDAVAAWDACLAVITTVSPSEWVQNVRDKRDAAEAEIQHRSPK